jgi:hypothetical protein
MAFGEEVRGTLAIPLRWPPAKKLVEDIGGTLVTLADVPYPKQAQFLEEVQGALAVWVWDVLAANDKRLFEKGDRLLRRIFGNAEALHKQLSELLDAFLATASFEEHTPAARVSDYVCVKVDDELGQALNDLGLKISRPTNLNITIFLWVVSSLLRAIEAALEDKRTAGLEALVFKLARAAYRADGKFTAHRKLGRKGSLIKALNEIKDRLPNVDNEIGAELADALPAPDQHPVATYERLLRRGARPSRTMHSHSAG